MKRGDVATVGHTYLVAAPLRGKTGVITSTNGDHYALEIDNRTVFVEKGCLVEEGAPTEMKEEPVPEKLVVDWRLAGPGIGVILLCLLALALSGCGASYTVAAVHLSHPTETQVDSTINGIELGAEWTRGKAFAEVGATYAVQRTNMYGGPLSTTFKVGLRFGDE